MFRSRSRAASLTTSGGRSPPESFRCSFGVRRSTCEATTLAQCNNIGKNTSDWDATPRLNMTNDDLNLSIFLDNCWDGLPVTVIFNCGC